MFLEDLPYVNVYNIFKNMLAFYLRLITNIVKIY
jgi:hypothetical protein